MNRPPTTKVFVEGRYRKLSRDLPQTVFFCPECKGHPRRRRKCTYCDGFGKLTRDSIQELVAWVLGKACQTRKNKFHGSGREDIDVRMLGRGRPFVLELVGPRCTDVDLAEVERTINDRNAGRLEVEGLHWTEKARVRVLKEGKHAKRYRALVGVEGDVDAGCVEAVLGRRVQLAQQTPERVAHRRADKVRERWIQLDQLEPLEDGRWELVVTAQHGTYVKEAISGEKARTDPSLGELLGGVTCTCEELDVLAILDEEGQEELVPETLERPATFGTGIETGAE
jgi:tRNA pseudouridine synthase 10